MQWSNINHLNSVRINGLLVSQTLIAVVKNSVSEDNAASLSGLLSYQNYLKDRVYDEFSYLEDIRSEYLYS